MNQQFIPLTPSEMFFGIKPQLVKASVGAFVNTSNPVTSATSITITPAPIPGIITNQQIAFGLGHFIGKYKWEIGFLLVAAGVVIYVIHEDKKHEKQKNLRITSPQTQNNYSFINQ